MRTAKTASRRPARARSRERPADDVVGLPGPLYCDTSALLKAFVREAGSDEFNALLRGRDDVVVSELAVTELVSALTRRQRQGVVTPDVVTRVYRAIVERLATATHQRLELTRDVHRRAERLLMSLADIPLRAADALHLALAMSAHARSLASFDARLAAAARTVGLTTYPG